MNEDKKTAWVEPQIENYVFLKKTEDEKYTFHELMQEIAGTGVKILLKNGKDVKNEKWFSIFSGNFEIKNFCFKIPMKGGQGEVFVEDLMKVKLYESQENRDSSFILIKSVLKTPFVIKRKSQKFLSLLQNKVLGEKNHGGLKMLVFPTQAIINETYKDKNYSNFINKYKKIKNLKEIEVEKQDYRKAGEIREEEKKIVDDFDMNPILLKIHEKIAN